MSYLKIKSEKTFNKTRLLSSIGVAMVSTIALTGCFVSDNDNVLKHEPTSVIAPLDAESKEWFESAEVQVANNAEEVEQLVASARNEKGQAKNIILFIGDGMGMSTVTASRILEGQNKGMMGEENQLSFETLPYAGLIKTYNTNQQTPDSAGTATAMLTGVKTKAGVLAVNDIANRATCAGANGQQGTELVTALELASMAGKATGIVTTARLTHATPAAAYAKSSERNWESNDKLTDEAVGANCKDIAVQFVESPYVNVAFGGGRRHFINTTVTDIEGKTGKRTDNADLVDLWKDKNSDGVYVENQAQFDAIADDADKVLGLFNSSHMQYEADRDKDAAGEPSLTDMTTKAIDLLSQDEDGYFMLVESGRIDHGHHAGSAYNALTDTIEFSNAVKAAMDKTSADDTLIIVTADHSHVFTLAGYPTRGNNILGKVVGNDDHGEPDDTPTLAKDDMPYTTLGYANGLGFRDYEDETNADVVYKDGSEVVTGRIDLSDIDTTKSGFHQEALVPLESESHSGEDVGIYARGPGAHLVTSTSEQNEIFHIMNYAGDLSGSAERAQSTN